MDAATASLHQNGLTAAEPAGLTVRGQDGLRRVVGFVPGSFLGSYLL